MKLYKLILLVIVTSNCYYSQSLNQGSGFLYLPNARIINDGQVVIGLTQINRGFLKWGFQEAPSYISYMTIGFIPRIDVTLRITKNSLHRTSDRQWNLRFQVLTEYESPINVLIGLHDIIGSNGGFTTTHFNATYLILSKTFNYDHAAINSLEIAVGYAGRLFRSINYDFLGFILASQLSLYGIFSFIIESNNNFINAGISVSIFDKIHLIGGFTDMKHFSGGVAVSFVL